MFSSNGHSSSSVLPANLDGVDPAWSRVVTATDSTGVPRTWHILDNAPSLAGATPAGTLLCVHGNPTWSYVWRHVLKMAAAADPPWRAIAVDHLDMGFSERTGTVRRLGQRVADLGTLTDALGLTGPIVSVGHDWGGVISLGWALRHREQLIGVVLTNTAVHQPEGRMIPPSMYFSQVPPTRWLVTKGTPGFILSMLALANPPLPPRVWKGYMAPYHGAKRRDAVREFVKDIPLKPTHPSWDALQEISQNLGQLRDVPVLFMWGPRDPVFRDMHYRDLRQRLPHATVHRFERAGHLLPDEADVAGAVKLWLTELQRSRAAGAPQSNGAGATGAQANGAVAPTLANSTAPPEPDRLPLWHFLDERAEDETPAIIEPPLAGGGTEPRTVSWAELSRQTRQGAAGLYAMGVRKGDRVALLVTPGPELTIAMCACIRMGAVIVVADAGLGVKGLHRAIRSANPKYIIGIDRALAAARALNWGGTPIAVGPGDKLKRAALGAKVTLQEVIASGAGLPLPPSPEPDDELGVMFTSGSTGPAKGVVYTHRQIQASRDLILATYDINQTDRMVAAFAPFALLGPQLGATASVPDMDVTAPGTLTAAALADAISAAGATQVFASPAALVNIARTAGSLTAAQREALANVRLLFSAGAPVPVSLLKEMIELMPKATPHTPYGMTEALPVTDVTMAEIVEAGPGNGVLVGRPVVGVEVAISPCDASGAAVGELTIEPDITGEIVVRGPHVKDHYDQLWITEHSSATRPSGWHRSGDVGHMDAQGRLWVEGRLAHVLSTPDGVLTPVGVEQRVQEVAHTPRAALVGVGPPGAQQAVAVVETDQAPRRGGGMAPPALAEAVRNAAGVELAAVLAVGELPTDIRHNSKIDRTRVSQWASRVLAGRRGGRL